MGLRRKLIAALAAAATALGALAPAAEGAKRPELLGDGGVSSFYGWDGAIEGPPGKLLKSEPQQPDLVLANAASGTRILYTSTDGMDGKSPIIVSGALYLPKGKAPAGGWPLMAWEHGTVGAADVCAPSFAGRPPRDITYLNDWLARGYAIVATDYQGLGTPGVHPYLAARPEAYSALDSIRAVQGGGFPVSKKVVLFGQSQGGGAAFATAAYAPSYAPELDIRGVVATGAPYFPARPAGAQPPPAPRPAPATAVANEQPTGTLAYAFYGAALDEFLDPDFDIETYYSPRALPFVRSIASTCLYLLEDRIIAAGLLRSQSYTGAPGPNVQGQTLNLRAYPTVKLNAPLFMGTGAVDRDVPPSMQLSLGEAACKAGTVVEQHLYPDFDHNGTVNGSTPDSSVFVAKAFAGQPIRGNCDNRPSLRP